MNELPKENSCASAFSGDRPLIRAVIFDFGRVISAQKPESLFSGYERELGLRSGTINTIMFACSDWEDALLGRKTMAEYWTAVGPRLGLNSPELIEAFRRRYYGDEKINAHVVELIRRLAGRCKLAICSNFPSGLDAWLAEWEIDNLFEVVFCSGNEGVVKPDHAAFRTTLSRLGVGPSEAVFVDDDPENVGAASRYGLHAIHFTDAPALERALSALMPLQERAPAVHNRR
jgi:putative hydrolase of the HAD superfamily